MKEIQGLSENLSRSVANDPTQIFQQLEQTVTGSDYYSSYLSVVQGIFEIQSNVFVGREIWKILETMVKNIAQITSDNPVRARILFCSTQFCRMVSYRMKSIR